MRRSQTGLRRMQAYQTFNPLDLFFFIADESMRRVGLPGASIHLCLELAGTLDLAGLKQAICKIHRRYPATAARIVRSSITGKPCWQLPHQSQQPKPEIVVHELPDASEANYQHALQALLNSQIPLSVESNIHLHVFRGLPEGDRLVVRWPHHLMDGRGGVTLLEEIESMYADDQPIDAITSTGDEDRNDFAEVTRGVRKQLTLSEIRISTQGLRPAGWRSLHLGSRPPMNRIGPVSISTRHFTSEQLQQARQTSLEVCGFARFGDFMRASAIRSLHRVMPATNRLDHPKAGYCTLSLVDHRKRRQVSPVCRNFTNVLPLNILQNIADDRRAIADEAREQTAGLLEKRAMINRLIAVEHVARLPASLLIDLMSRKLATAGNGAFATGMGAAPTLPLGLIGSFSKTMNTFCGTKLVNIYGLRPVPFQTGLSIDINEAQGRMNIAAMYYDSIIPAERVNTLLDDFATSLLSRE